MSIAQAICAQRMKMKRKGMWRGGAVTDRAPGVAKDHQADDLHVEKTYNTSGEPHTRGLDEETHPMEFMADGGEVYDYEGDDEPDRSAPVSGGYAHGGEIEDDEEYMPGATTMDVRPEVMPSLAGRFHSALKRRPRRFAG